MLAACCWAQSASPAAPGGIDAGPPLADRARYISAALTCAAPVPDCAVSRRSPTCPAAARDRVECCCRRTTPASPRLCLKRRHRSARAEHRSEIYSVITRAVALLKSMGSHMRTRRHRPRCPLHSRPARGSTLAPPRAASSLRPGSFPRTNAAGNPHRPDPPAHSLR